MLLVSGLLVVVSRLCGANTLNGSLEVVYRAFQPDVVPHYQLFMLLTLSTSSSALLYRGTPVNKLQQDDEVEPLLTLYSIHHSCLQKDI